MPICKVCGDEVEELVNARVEGKRQKLCEDCAEEAEQADEIARESESVVQGMMGFKGRR